MHNLRFNHWFHPGEARATHMSLGTLLGPFRGRKLQSRFPRWRPYGINFVRFGSKADIAARFGKVR
jgi:hypothetical protein